MAIVSNPLSKLVDIIKGSDPFKTYDMAAINLGMENSMNSQQSNAMQNSLYQQSLATSGSPYGNGTGSGGGGGGSVGFGGYYHPISGGTGGQVSTAVGVASYPWLNQYGSMSHPSPHSLEVDASDVVYAYAMDSISLMWNNEEGEEQRILHGISVDKALRMIEQLQKAVIAALDDQHEDRLDQTDQ